MLLKHSLRVSDSRRKTLKGLTRLLSDAGHGTPCRRAALLLEAEQATFLGRLLLQAGGGHLADG